MENQKICPFMSGNYCQKERCGLWALPGRLCAVTQIGSSLASINGNGLYIDELYDVNESVKAVNDTLCEIRKNI